MLTSLAIQNIKEKKFRTLLVILSITIAAASLILFMGLKNGIENATFAQLESKNPLTQITVRPQLEQTGIITFLTQSETGKISDSDIEKISQIEGINNIYPETQFNSFASIEVDLLGLSLITDGLLFGLPEEFIHNDIIAGNIDWESLEEPYPTILPRKILDLYNYSLASPQGLPTISEEGLLGKELVLYPNYSTFFPGLSEEKIATKLEVVGFSDKVNLVGVTLSSKLVEELNTTYTSSNGKSYIELFVETSDAKLTTEIAGEIEAMGFSTTYYQKNIQEVEGKLTYLELALGIISLIILLTAAIAIISTFLATVSERTKEIGLFRALGANKSHIKRIILIEAFIVGIIGSIAGIILGVIASRVIDKFELQQLTPTTFSADTLFLIDLNTMLFILLFGTLLSILSAYIPAQKAANLDPIQALKK